MFFHFLFKTFFKFFLYRLPESHLPSFLSPFLPCWPRRRATCTFSVHRLLLFGESGWKSLHGTRPHIERAERKKHNLIIQSLSRQLLSPLEVPSPSLPCYVSMLKMCELSDFTKRRKLWKIMKSKTNESYFCSSQLGFPELFKTWV